MPAYKMTTRLIQCHPVDRSIEAARSMCKSVRDQVTRVRLPWCAASAAYALHAAIRIADVYHRSNRTVEQADVALRVEESGELASEKTP